LINLAGAKTKQSGNEVGSYWASCQCLVAGNVDCGYLLGFKQLYRYMYENWELLYGKGLQAGI